MKLFGQVPTGAPGWAKYRRNVFRIVRATCGIPKMVVEMLLAAEAWEGKPEKFVIAEAWEHVDAQIAYNSNEAITDTDMVRELTALQDRYLTKYISRLPGLVYWIVVCRAFKRSSTAAKTMAM